MQDPYAGLNGDMLVAQTIFQFGEDTGHRTVLALTGPAAFDVLREGGDVGGTAARGRVRSRGDSEARPLTAGPTGGQG